MIEQGDIFGVSQLFTQNILRGALAKPPNVFIHCPVVNLFTSSAANDAVQVLNRAILAIPGKKLVVGNSGGAALIHKWINEYGPTTSVTVAEIRFLCLANPLRRYGGWGIVPNPPISILGLINFGTTSLPVGTPWRVTDFARRWDPISDAYTSATPSPEAVENSLQGYGLHFDYYHVGLDDPEVVKHVDGNVTYALHRTPLVPTAANSWWLSAADKAAKHATLFPLIEASYTRPVYS